MHTQKFGDYSILYEVDYNYNLIGIVNFQFVLIATVFFQLGLGNKLLQSLLL